LLVVSLAETLHPVLGAIGAVIAWSVGMWAVFYAGFTVQGFLLQRQGVWRAFVDSLRVVHYNLSATMRLYLTLFVLTLGLSGIWSLPPDNSWALLIGLAGHALIATVLVTATFVFYKDRYRWWTELQKNQQAQLSKPTKPSV
jgi:hypothetical protein